MNSTNDKLKDEYASARFFCLHDIGDIALSPLSTMPLALLLFASHHGTEAVVHRARVYAMAMQHNMNRSQTGLAPEGTR